MAQLREVRIERKATRQPERFESDGFLVSYVADLYPGDDRVDVERRLVEQADALLNRWLRLNGHEPDEFPAPDGVTEAVEVQGSEVRVQDSDDGTPEDADHVQVALSLGGLDEVTFHEWLDRLQAEYGLVLYDGIELDVDGKLSAKVWRGHVSVEQYVELSEALEVAGNVYDVVLLDEVSATRLALAMEAVNGEADGGEEE